MVWRLVHAIRGALRAELEQYVVRWQPGGGAGPVQQGPFGLDTQVQFRQITDGLSNTMFMSEIMMAMQDNYYDTRGDMLNDDSAAPEYETINTPNAGVDYMLCRRGPE